MSERFESDKLVKISDGSIVFTLLYDYSDHGSYNELWMIKNGVLEKNTTFLAPSAYISGIIPSSKRELIAVTTRSNKSECVVIIDTI